MQFICDMCLKLLYLRPVILSFEVPGLCVRGHVFVITDPLRTHCLKTSQVPPNLIGHGCPDSGPFFILFIELENIHA